MRISDWSSDVCSSDLGQPEAHQEPHRIGQEFCHRECPGFALGDDLAPAKAFDLFQRITFHLREFGLADLAVFARVAVEPKTEDQEERSAEHTPELQSLTRNSYAAL